MQYTSCPESETALWDSIYTYFTIQKKWIGQAKMQSPSHKTFFPVKKKEFKSAVQWMMNLHGIYRGRHRCSRGHRTSDRRLSAPSLCSHCWTAQTCRLMHGWSETGWTTKSNETSSVTLLWGLLYQRFWAVKYLFPAIVNVSCLIWNLVDMKTTTRSLHWFGT